MIIILFLYAITWIGSYKWLCKDDGSLNISSIKMPFCVQFNDWTNQKPTYDSIHIVHVIFSDIIQDCVFTFNCWLRDGRVRFIVHLKMVIKILLTVNTLCKNMSLLVGLLPVNHVTIPWYTCNHCRFWCFKGVWWSTN